MSGSTLLLPPAASAPAPPITPLRLVSILFRRRRLIAIAFGAVFIPVLLASLLMPLDYVSQMKILVQRRRSDPMITSNVGANEPSDSMVLARLDDKALDTEVDLLQSADVLRQAVLSCGLWSRPVRWNFGRPVPAKETRVAQAMQGLRKLLKVNPPKAPNRSDVITVEYRAHRPEQAASVLQAVFNAYMEKNLQVHAAPGASEFFNREVEQNRRDLETAEARLVAFTKDHGVVAADTEDSTLLLKTAEFDASLQATTARIHSVEDSIRNLEAQRSTTPQRVTTRVRSSPELRDKLKETLHSLELQRSQLLAKYQPSYRLVTDVDKQIAETRAAISTAEQSPTQEITSDQDPVYLWVSGELARARTERVALQAQAAQTENTLRQYRAKAVNLQGLGREQQQLMLAAKAAEDAYAVALRKQSEARTAEALDRARILNVSLAQAPTVPVLPAVSRLTKVMLGTALALVLSLGLAFVCEQLDQTFHVPYEVESYLELPVLAALPRPGEAAIESPVTALPPHLAV